MTFALSDNFFARFKTGDLAALCDEITTYFGMNVNLRGDCVLVYYCGVNILRICENGDCGIASSYLEYSQIQDTPKFKGWIANDLDGGEYATINTNAPGFAWNALICFIMMEIDGMNLADDHAKKISRFMDENAWNSDYVVFDAAYSRDASAPFDLIALHWPRAVRDCNTFRPSIAFITLDTNMKSNLDYVLTPDLCRDVEKMLAQMCELSFVCIKDAPLKLTPVLRPCIIHAGGLDGPNDITIPENVDVRILVPSRVGYGLYDTDMFDIDALLRIRALRFDIARNPDRPITWWDMASASDK